MANVDRHSMDPKTWAVPKSNTLMRSYFAKTGRFPTVAQIQGNLGPLISEAIFESIPPELKETIGLEPKMKGPEGSLWCSPSSQLVGQLKLKLVPSQRHLHALTHQAILEIGGDIEELVTKIIQRELEEKLAQQIENFEKALEERVQYVRKKVIREFYELSSLKMRELFNQMEADFKEEWEKREKYLLVEAEKERLESLRVLEEMMRCELENVTRLHENKYTAQLHFLADWEKANAHDDYHQKIMRMLQKWSQLFHNVQRAEALKSRAELKQQSVHQESELWATLTKEREYADAVLYEVVKHHKNQLIGLNEVISNLRDKVSDVCKQRDEYIDDVDAWKCVLRDLFNQFQKFINFVLNEIPGQAGYLLSLTEIMNKRKECLPRVREDILEHKYTTQDKKKVETWEEVLVRPVDRTNDPNLYEWKSTIDIEDEDDDRRRLKEDKKEEEYLKIIAEGKKNEECIDLIKKTTQWVLKKVEGLQLTPPPSLPSSSCSQVVSAVESDATPYIDPDLLLYAQYMEKCIPETFTETMTEKHVQIEKRKDATMKVHVLDDDFKTQGPCPDPFVSDRINSILNLLDAHPHLKSALASS